jgi:hypothetical protein
MPDDHSRETLEDVRALVARLLASVEASERDLSHGGDFRYQLIRGHALAMLDQLEELARASSDDDPSHE